MCPSVDTVALPLTIIAYLAFLPILLRLLFPVRVLQAFLSVILLRTTRFLLMLALMLLKALRRYAGLPVLGRISWCSYKISHSKSNWENMTTTVSTFPSFLIRYLSLVFLVIVALLLWKMILCFAG